MTTDDRPYVAGAPTAGRRSSTADSAVDVAAGESRFSSALDLVEHNARQTARRLRCGDITLDDLRSLASEGLLRASRSFDPSLGTPFRRWANRRIRDWLAEGLRQWAHLPRYRVVRRQQERDTMKVAGARGSGTAWRGAPDASAGSKQEEVARCLAMASAEETALAIARQAEFNPEQLASERELLQRLREALERLPGRQRTLIERHDLGGESLPQVARSLGISKSWATRLRMRALGRMARDLKGVEGDDSPGLGRFLRRSPSFLTSDEK